MAADGRQITIRVVAMMSFDSTIIILGPFAFLLLYTCPSVSAILSGNYTRCTGLDSRFDGYTYKQDPVTGGRIWSHCSFPSPLADHALCGRIKKEGSYYLCDPDNLLPEEQGVRPKVRGCSTETSTICTRTDGRKESFRVAVALVNLVRIPDFNSTELCMNDCGQLRPEIDQNGTYPDADEKDEILRLFADGLRQLWAIGSCENDVIVLYCKEFNEVYLSVGSQASNYLPADKVTDLRKTFRTYLAEHGYDEGLERGLLDIISSLKVSLQGLTVAHIIAILNGCVVLFLAFVLFYYLLVKRFQMNIWGEELTYILWEAFVKTVSGLWLVQGVMMTYAYMSHKGQGEGLWWALGVAIFAFCCCMGMYFVSEYHFYKGGDTW